MCKREQVKPARVSGTKEKGTLKKKVYTGKLTVISDFLKYLPKNMALLVKNLWTQKLSVLDSEKLTATTFWPWGSSVVKAGAN